MTLTEDGKVGVGTTNPQRTFHVDGDILINGHEGSIYFGNEHYPEYLETGEWAIEFAPEYEGNQSGLNFWKPSGSHNLSSEDGYGNYYLFISDDGNVGIGTGTPQAKLHIKVDNDNDIAFAVYKGSTENFRIQGDGRFFARGYKIKLGGFPDYVFHKDHKRMTFEKRAFYYLKYGRMPLMASDEEVKKEGLDVGNTLIGLTFNLEEIALNQNDLYKMFLQFKKETEVRMNKLEKSNEKKDKIIIEKDKTITKLKQKLTKNNLKYKMERTEKNNKKDIF